MWENLMTREQESGGDTVADLRRAALALLSLLAVVLAASLFPASGFGSHPGSGGGVADLQSGVTGTGTGAGDPPATPAGPSDGSGGGSTDDGTATPTATPTPTPTPTATPTPDRPDEGAGPSSGGSLLGTVVGLLVAAVAVVVGLGTVAQLREGARDREPIDLDGTRVDGAALAPLYDLLPPPLALGLWRLSQGTTALLVGATAVVPSALAALSSLFDGVGGAAGALVDGLVRPGGRALVAVPRAIAAGFGGVAGGLGSALIALPAALAGIGSGLPSPSLPSFGGDEGDDDAAATAPSTGDGGADSTEPAPPSVEEAWATLRELVRLPNARSRTPGEVARAAVDAGLPADAVAALTAAFREVRYADRPADGGRLATARDAIDRIRRAVEREVSDG